jgi:inositol-phosphate phosphatase/L-galactose 1-phosphate phosphatase/histidinol-phosphatase
VVNHSSLLAFAHELADAAGAVIRPCFGAHGTVEAKADNSPVTKADREAEHVMRHKIHQQFPAHHIYGEEYGALQAEPLDHPTIPSSHHRYMWLLDPIDGTRAFIAGKKQWGTLIALCKDDVPILGILDQPVTRERWSAVRGEATLYTFHSRAGGNPDIKEALDARSGMHDHLKKATLSTTSTSYFTAPERLAFTRLKAECGEFIENGDCYAYGLLARAQRDIVVDAGLKPYDILALIPIIESAGGVITRWNGAPVTFNSYSDVIAARTPDLHRQAQKLLQGA